MFRLLTCLIFVFLFGCTTYNAGNPEFIVNALWVQDTLASQNNQFRKVNRMTPVIYKNSIIVGNAYDGLVSYDLSSRKLNWRQNISLGVEASGAHIRDTLFVGSNNGIMYSIDLADGEINWKFDTKSELVAQPLLEDGVLYFVSSAQSLYALDAASGKQLWVHSRQDTSSGMSIRGGSRPTISGSLLYVGFSDGAVVAINVKTGTEQWEITLNRNTKFKDIDSSPVIAGDLMYINSYDDKLYCISKDKGQIIWSADYGGAGTPLVVKDKVFVTSSKGILAALNRETGKLIWKKSTKNGVFVEPMQYGNLIVSGESQGKLNFYRSEDGIQIGQFDPGRGVFSKPITVQDQLYFISGEGNLYGIEAKFEKKSSIYFLR